MGAVLSEVPKTPQLSRAHFQELRQQLPVRVSTAEARERVREVESTLQGKYGLERKTLLTPTQLTRNKSAWKSKDHRLISP
jgi:hypothetical protein